MTHQDTKNGFVVYPNHESNFIMCLNIDLEREVVD